MVQSSTLSNLLTYLTSIDSSEGSPREVRGLPPKSRVESIVSWFMLGGKLASWLR